MKLNVDLLDFHSLKSLIAVELTEQLIDIVDTNLPSSNKKGYYGTETTLLEVSDSLSLHKSNAICLYILESSKLEERSDLNDSWLNWEHNELNPALHPLVTQEYSEVKPGANTTEALAKYLKYLDEQLHKGSLTSDHKAGVSSGEICIWCSIYPMAANSALRLKYLQPYKSITKWFDKLAGQKSFATVIQRITKNRGIQFYTGETKMSTIPTNSSDNQPGDAGTEAVSEVTQEEIAIGFDSFISGRKAAGIRRKTEHPLLPVAGERNVLITSALPYVNNVPHLGNIIGCVLSADVFARYCRLRNYNTLYLCGTDEYGTATETKALEEKLTPKQICDKYHKLHKEIYDWFDISFDFFGRTTTQKQTEIAQEIFWDLHRNNYLFEDSMEQLFCENCTKFLSDRFVEGTCPSCGYEDARGDQCDKCSKLINAVELRSPRCKICSQQPVVRSSKHLFLDLPKLAPIHEEWFEKTIAASGLWTNSALGITKSWMREGLKPRCISRDLKWGTPVPLEGFKDKVFYVWYDAPIGYPSICANYTDHWERWFKNPDDVSYYEFMAKDNVPFHAIIFPACELGTGKKWTILNHLLAIEYLQYEDEKFSKSRGVGVFGGDAKETGIPADIWRFYLLYIRPETQDASFSWSDFMTKNNSELLSNLGNFVNRSATFLANSFQGTVPRIELNDEDKVLIARVNRELQEYLSLLERATLRDAIRNILSISRLGNQYMQGNTPWVLVKGTTEQKLRAGTVIALSVNISCLLSTMLDPYMPATSAEIRRQLNVPAEFNVLNDRFVCLLPEGHKIGVPKVLFRKIEESEINALKAKFAGTQLERAAVTNGVTVEMPLPRVEVSPEELASLETEIAKQGELVRTLKISKAEKAVVDKEVTTLLKLKADLTLAKGSSAVDAQTADSGKKKRGNKKEAAN